MGSACRSRPRLQMATICSLPFRSTRSTVIPAHALLEHPQQHRTKALTSSVQVAPAPLAAALGLEFLNDPCSAVLPLSPYGAQEAASGGWSGAGRSVPPEETHPSRLLEGVADHPEPLVDEPRVRAPYATKPDRAFRAVRDKVAPHDSREVTLDPVQVEV